MWDRIREQRRDGVTVVITTHSMDEATELADRVGIMDHGHLLKLGAPADLTRSLPGKTTLELALSADDDSRNGVIPALAALDGVEQVEQVEGAEERVRLYVTGDAPLMVAPVAALLERHRVSLTDVKIGEPSLEDVFISLTGRALR